MLESLKSRGGKRWPRGQRFQLTPAGVDSEAAHASAVRDARAQGRTALESAQRRWAEPLGLDPADGVVLAELKVGRRSLADICTALESCGLDKAQVKVSVDRLVEKQLAEPLPTQLEA
ncbi:MAG TPA: hypothetical protein VLD85_03760 [Anaeromyxobacteraceae bacterium]|nr:hypothetical protein [Anaeromyxobacteraceae bacterium]